MPRHKHADVIIAWANGEEIECRMAVGNEWMPCTQTTHQFSDLNEYRIKPKIVKREGWVNVYRSLSERILWAGAQIYETKEEASKGIHQDFVACIHIEWEEEV